MQSQTYIAGRWFHAAQSWYRQIQEIDFTNKFEFVKWLHNIKIYFANLETESDCFAEDFMSELSIDE